jgi:hypothetical protein
MESNDSVGKISIETHSRRESNRHVGAEAHHERGERRDGGSSGNKVALDNFQADVVLRVGSASWVGGRLGADAGTARVGKNCRVDLCQKLELRLLKELMSFKSIPK